jgi:hypothetical protein
MAFVNQDGAAGPEGENGMEFTASDTLELRAGTLADVAVRACMQNFNDRTIAFDQTQTFAQGASGVSLGSFKPGNYVVRVIVEDTLVKNFTNHDQVNWRPLGSQVVNKEGTFSKIGGGAGKQRRQV